MNSFIVQLPLPHSIERVAATISAIESHTNKMFQCEFVAPNVGDDDLISVYGNVKGIGYKTWEKFSIAVEVALRNL